MKRWDAIVVGARCAGSALALALAQRGCRVLLLDHRTLRRDDQEGPAR